MEVRSNIEKCGAAATADSVTADDTVSPTAEALASKSKKNNFATEATAAIQSKITANENTAEIMMSSAMTKDESKCCNPFIIFNFFSCLFRYLFRVCI